MSAGGAINSMLHSVAYNPSYNECIHGMVVGVIGIVIVTLVTYILLRY